ncbi:MAG: Maf-like protein [Alphaproteobacteria bacterium]|nr:Maf-like protein [Alphaproteobacteria bacterium]
MANKFILASGSKARVEMLRGAGFKFDVIPADIDEDAIKDIFSGNKFEDLAHNLSLEKAKAISRENKDFYVVGSDQLLIFNNQVLSKAKNLDSAREKLKHLRGQEHRLTSAVSVVKNEKEIWSSVDCADLTMNDFSDDFLDQYLERAGEILTSCVGSYALESIGIQLFSKIKGDYFTILGMPLLPLSNFLQKEGFGL